MKQEKPAQVKTSLELPESVWKAAKMHAVAERTDLRSVVIAALELYLKMKRSGTRGT